MIQSALNKIAEITAKTQVQFAEQRKSQQMKFAADVWNKLSEGARFFWLEEKGFLPAQCGLNASKKFEQLAASIQLLLAQEYV